MKPIKPIQISAKTEYNYEHQRREMLDNKDKYHKLISNTPASKTFREMIDEKNNKIN